MFHDMRNSRAVSRRGAEPDTEHLVIVILLYQKNPGPALLVTEQISLRLDSGQILFLQYLIRLQVSDTHLLFSFSFRFTFAIRSTTHSIQFFISLQEKSPVPRNFFKEKYPPGHLISVK